MSEVNKKYVPEGVFLVCDKGEIVTQLIASPTNTVHLYGAKSCLETDNKFEINISTFGTCKQLGTCKFAQIQWTKVKEAGVKFNGASPLLDHSEGICAEGQGKIKIYFDEYEADLANENNNESPFVDESISSYVLGTILGGPLIGVASLFSDDAAKLNRGIGKGFKKGMEGTWDFLCNTVKHPIDTAKGLGKMGVIAGAYTLTPLGALAGDPILGGLDSMFGTDFKKTKDGIVDGVKKAGSNAIEDVKRGNWEEVGESIGQIDYAVVEALVGSKGAGLALKGMSTATKALVGAERLAEIAANAAKFTARIKSGLGIVKVGRKTINTLDDLLKAVKRGEKPLNSPDVKKWLAKEGKIEILEDGIWKYTDWEGNVVKYKNGHPVFEKPHVRQSVKIKQKGNYTTDYIDAEKSSKEIPPKLSKKETVWHHHEDGITMQEVDRKIHERFTHKGGVSAKKNKVAFGKK